MTRTVKNRNKQHDMMHKTVLIFLFSLIIYKNTIRVDDKSEIVNPTSQTIYAVCIPVETEDFRSVA